MSIEIKSVNGKVFKLGGTSYPKGQVKVIYDHNNVDPATGVVGESKVPTVKFQFIDGMPIDHSAVKYTAYVDGNGDAFADFDTFSAAVAGILAPSTATDASVLTVDGEAPDEAGNVVSKLIADKGTVTQATSVSTGVTLNQRSGVITTVSLALAADASATFTLTNSFIDTSSVIMLTCEYATASAGMLYATVSSTASGSAVIELTNVGTATLNAVGKIHFIVL